MRRVNMQLAIFIVSLGFLQVTAFSNPNLKTCWAKRILQSDYYVAGRLTARQMKYAVDVGFKTIVSLNYYEHPADDDLEVFPSTAMAARIANIANITYRQVLRRNADWLQVSTVEKLDDILQTAPKPLLYFSDDQSIATFTLLLTLTNQTTTCEACEYTVNMSISTFFKIASDFGFDFYKTDFLNLIKSVAGVDVKRGIAPSLALPRWYESMWSLRPVAYNWYMSGQLTRDLVRRIDEMGFTTIINFRKGVNFKGNASQEGVNLLNIKSRTGTYKDGGRQSTARLLQTRIDPDRPNAYISDNSSVNYESRNPLEYGDSIGYNETQQEQHIHITTPGIEYMHLPVAGRTAFSISLWNRYKDDLLRAQCRGPILAHCSTGYRAAMFSVLTLAYVHQHGSDWAFSKCRDIGYDAESNPSAANMYREVLDSASRERRNAMSYCDTNSGYSNHATVFTIFVTLLLCSFIY